MARRASGFAWALTPLVAVTGTLLGVLALAYGQGRLVPRIAGGVERVCGTVDCGLGVGVTLILFGFLVVCVAMTAGCLVALRRREDPDGRRAVWRGVWITGWCLVVYAALSVVAWWPKL
ncbi:hypothetical protein LX15_003815 [Streptoalloteichus tenebrarius]|uniref:Integral membrane protein n=1 Tax=Streptoalloteichus tenebrarius (strain ATCC 17920 / DSM 40477 / JCM 4838 / CBS 697.72 / NBRC 16177 / NCIMB 11028 / NRRL B-12390 / A12253. 1 / ISP 5477) TaxID=1933 RepID=A0ABT1HX74_STRSD|nr:hypothetical protein [Streptoalloteichus tenebrarius]MCP2260104.1 hypothetical protein [Streptoalloteichus tenebrarius]BFF00576.1 hypothetical protein GCM10020241_22510 [Streptoalloteichus tenebrarius]